MLFQWMGLGHLVVPCQSWHTTTFHDSSIWIWWSSRLLLTSTSQSVFYIGQSSVGQFSAGGWSNFFAIFHHHPFREYVPLGNCPIFGDSKNDVENTNFEYLSILIDLEKYVDIMIDFARPCRRQACTSWKRDPLGHSDFAFTQRMLTPRLSVHRICQKALLSFCPYWRTSLGPYTSPFRWKDPQKSPASFRIAVKDLEDQAL